MTWRAGADAAPARRQDVGVNTRVRRISESAGDAAFAVFMVEQIPAFSHAAKIERRAQKIVDPIERLRYLRRATGEPAGLPFHFQWTWLATAVVAMILVPMASDAVNREPLRRRLLAAAALRPPGEVPNVWPVEQNKDYDLYSNGLRIENRLEISNQPRSYTLIERATGALGPRRFQ